METLQAKLQSYDEKLEKISVAFLKFKEESRIELKKLTLDREKIVKELKRLQESFVFNDLKDFLINICLLFNLCTTWLVRP